MKFSNSTLQKKPIRNFPLPSSSTTTTTTTTTTKPALYISPRCHLYVPHIETGTLEVNFLNKDVVETLSVVLLELVAGEHVLQAVSVKLQAVVRDAVVALVEPKHQVNYRWIHDDA